MTASVVFHALNRRFLQREEDMPEQARQVIYQTLALGHHIGVIDCLKVVLTCPLDGFTQWLTRWPAGEAHDKLAGILKWGEIMIDVSHVQMLAKAIDQTQADFSAEEMSWATTLMVALQSIEAEPAMYLMVRRCDC